MKRFLLIILGTAVGIDKDLNFIADGETGVNFVDGKGMFICTFYSPLSISEIHEKMAHRPAMLVFDITNDQTYGVNLPTKYYLGIFPEIQKTFDSIKWEPIARDNRGRLQEKEVKEVNEVVTEVEEYSDVNDILDKLSRNNYDRKCLTEKEIQILNKG